MSTTTVGTETKPFAWSYSALKNFETCPRRYEAYSVTREVAEPESEAIKQGHALHAAFEARVTKGEKLPLGMGMHEGMLAKLASAPGKVYAEQKLALTAELKPSAWFGKGTWFRQVVDYTNLRDDGSATALDYKSGKPGHPDTTQLDLTAATLFAHEPKVTRVKAALLFVAYGQTERAEYTREDISAIWGRILPRVKKLWQARQENVFPPKPGPFCKRYCGVRSCPFWGR
jgi:PD-(D/E)XK nuclease superfamily protein